MAGKIAVTVNLSEELASEFRRVAVAVFGARKGSLGKALSEALSAWISVRSEKSSEALALKYLKEGLPLGYKPYSSRDELHAR